MPRDVGALCLEGLSAWDEPPDRDRPEPVVAHDRCQDDDGAGRSRPAAESSCSDRRGREEDRDLGRDVVVVDRALSVDRREQVQGKLRYEGDEQ